MRKEPLNLTIDANLKRKVKARAALLGVTVSDVVAEFLFKWLEETEDEARKKEGES
jgi:antitoxin component of RelBE/YafQ-DinJ toxin-antitoxin module